MSIQDALRQIPSVDVLLNDPRLEELAGNTPHQIMVEAIRETADQARKDILAGVPLGADGTPMTDLIITEAQRYIEAVMKCHFRKVINATGVVLHTALGRAALARQAIEQVTRELSGYSLLQMDLETGERSVRDAKIEKLLQRLTGVEAATVVNNNAAATSLVLNAIGAGKEVIVSRGQLVEIGGSFRLPDVMAASGAKMVEVGTTNKTHVKDYVNAITEDTAALLRVHPSNYKIMGFSSEVSLEDIVAVARERNLVMIDDVGAGSLIDFSRFGFDYEPTLLDSVKGGADLVTCSADKLIGAGQGGIILGREDLVKKIRKNPMARMMRVDKLALAVLEATLMLFLDEETALKEVPTLAMLKRTVEDLTQVADKIATSVTASTSTVEVEVVDGFSEMGSGSLPTQGLPTRLVAIKPRHFSAAELAYRLRQYEPPVVTRMQKEQVLIDPRTLLSDDHEVVAKALIYMITQIEMERGCGG
ncbi:MAG: L-seryl-tRNA(Sec) selenium transferase [Planctomycetes bacterium]|nr:L-seryl-tRNA(Sec) selenium transferase [Planctomycetota bacterium]